MVGLHGVAVCKNAVRQVKALPYDDNEGQKSATAGEGATAERLTLPSDSNSQIRRVEPILRRQIVETFPDFHWNVVGGSYNEICIQNAFQNERNCEIRAHHYQRPSRSWCLQAGPWYRRG